MHTYTCYPHTNTISTNFHLTLSLSPYLQAFSWALLGTPTSSLETKFCSHFILLRNCIILNRHDLSKDLSNFTEDHDIQSLITALPHPSVLCHTSLLSASPKPVPPHAICLVTELAGEGNLTPLNCNSFSKGTLPPPSLKMSSLVNEKVILKYQNMQIMGRQVAQ